VSALLVLLAILVVLTFLVIRLMGGLWPWLSLGWAVSESY
jgi:hypothetical protein